MSLIDQWQEKNNIFHYEGDTGVKNLEKLLKVLGYGHQFRFGDPVQHFLSDNPGAIEALLTWLDDSMWCSDEWKEALRDDLGLDTDNEDDV